MNTQIQPSVHSCTEIKRALRYVQGLSQVKKARDDEWYPLDRSMAHLYLSGFPKWQKKIHQYFSALKAQGEPVVFVDVGGRASGASLGATKSYSFSLQPISPFFTQSNIEIRFVGDIFSSRDFASFVSLIHKNGDRPAFVTCELYAGLQEYTPSSAKKNGKPDLHFEVTHQLLIHNLGRMIRVLRGGGFLMIGPPFQFSSNLGDFLLRKPQEEYRSSLHMKAMCNKFGCSVEVGSTINGPRWLIRKKLRR